MNDNKIVSRILREHDAKMRPHRIDSQANSMEAFLEEIEICDPYPENEHLAIKIIDELKKKWNLMF